MRSPLCSRCGCALREQVSETQSRCVDCGLRSGSARLTARRQAPGSSASPEEAERREAAVRQVRQVIAEEGRRALAAATFAPFGLDDRWTGERWVGGSGTSNGNLTALILGHGNAPRDMTAPQLRVETRPVDERSTVRASWDLARSHVQHFWMETGVLTDDVRRAAFRTDRSNVDPTEPWERVSLLVDSAPVEFRVLADENYWVAQAPVDGAVVGIQARSWSRADIGLVSIEDTSPYG